MFKLCLSLLADSASRPARSTTSIPGGKVQGTKLKPPVKQSRGRSPSPASRKKDERKDSELSQNNKSYSENSTKKDDKVEKARVTHKMHDKHSEEDGSKSHDTNAKFHTSRHSKQQHYTDKSDKHKLTRPESTVNARSKSPNRNKQTESAEVPEKTNTMTSMEHERCELTDDQQGSDKEVSVEEEGHISEPSTNDKPVERISYTKVVHCVME